MTRSDDDWVKTAMRDDSIVVKSLLSLFKSPSPSFHWTVRQRRSRFPAPASNLRGHEGDSERNRMKKKKKIKAESTRASPTTPLSWTSDSGDRSKEEHVSVKNEVTTTLKRPRKKKTLAELREEETLLLTERKKLGKVIKAMFRDVQIQRARNETLKRLKLDLESMNKAETLATTNGHNTTQCSFTRSLCHKAKDAEIRETGFSLPDLNLPADTDLDTSAVNI